MMKKNKLLKTFLLLTVMLVGSATNVLGQTTLFLWQSDGSTTTLETPLTAKGGTAAFYGTESPSTESAAYNVAVTDTDLKATGSKGHKLGKNTLYLKITLTGENKLQAGDIIYICGYNPFRVGTSVTSDNRANTDLIASVATGTSKTDYNVGSVTVPNTIGENVTEIYLSRANGSGTGLAAVKIVRPAVTTDPVITASDASITATESGVAVTKDIAVTGENLTGSTLTATLNPTVDGLSVSLASNTIADGAISTTATLSYTATENVSGTTTLTLSDGTTSKEVTITYTAKVVATELQAISEGTTWDFGTGVTGGKKFETEEDKNTEYVYADIEGLEFAQTFKADALAFKGEYPFRDDSHKYAQNGILHFKTTVPGTITVKFSDTGTSASATAVKRYLVVNDEQTEYWASRENNGTDNPYDAQLNVETGEISVPAGDVTITGSSAITVSKIVFTPATATVAVTGVTLDKTTAEVEVGKTVTLTATVAPENATNKNVTWESSDETVATVEDGVVTGVAEGTANITVTTVDGNKTATCVVTVVAAAPVETAAAPTLKLHDKGTNLIADEDDETHFTFDATKSGEIKLRIVAKPNTYVSYIATNTGMPDAPTLTTNTAVDNVGGSSDKESSNISIKDYSKTFYIRAIAWDADKNEASANEVLFTITGAVKVTATKEYSTFCSTSDLDFSNVEGLEANVVSSIGTSSAKTTKVNKVAAGTGLILKKTADVGTATDFSVPLASETDEIADNYMVGVTEDTNMEGVANVYILSDGKFYECTGGTLAAGKAYLNDKDGVWATTGAPSFSIIADDETTGINSVERGAWSVEGCYTLDGRRVEHPTKGLYIVNGKKVIIK